MDNPDLSVAGKYFVKSFKADKQGTSTSTSLFIFTAASAVVYAGTRRSYPPLRRHQPEIREKLPPVSLITRLKCAKKYYSRCSVIRGVWHSIYLYLKLWVKYCVCYSMLLISCAGKGIFCIICLFGELKMNITTQQGSIWANKPLENSYLLSLCFQTW